VARIVEQLGGQLRVDSKPNEGSRFSFLIPFELALGGERSSPPVSSDAVRPRPRSDSRTDSSSSEIDSLVEALSSDHMKKKASSYASRTAFVSMPGPTIPPAGGKFDVVGFRFPIRSLKLDEFDVDKSVEVAQIMAMASTPRGSRVSPPAASSVSPSPSLDDKLRVLIVEDDQINRSVLAKRLTIDGHSVTCATNGQEGVEVVEADRDFDCILMDIQMPILNGFEAAKRIRALENDDGEAMPETSLRASKRLNGRIPIFAVSASLLERQRDEMLEYGMDGWILKPIDFKRLRAILQGILDSGQRELDVYRPGYNWEAGGWLVERKARY